MVNNQIVNQVLRKRDFEAVDNLEEEMQTLYKSLCRELDMLLVEIIEDMEKYISVKIELEKTMNDGFVNIAKTRYINGSASVTTLQLPTEFSTPTEPQATVVRNDGDEGPQIYIVSKLAPDIPTNSSEKGVRKRTAVETKYSENSVESKIVGKPADPIRLFGVLVPQSLRSAQKSFIASLDQIAAAAQVQSLLDQKLTRYSTLLATKDKLTKRKA